MLSGIINSFKNKISKKGDDSEHYFSDNLKFVLKERGNSEISCNILLRDSESVYDIPLLMPPFHSLKEIQMNLIGLKEKKDLDLGFEEILSDEERSLYIKGYNKGYEERICQINSISDFVEKGLDDKINKAITETHIYFSSLLSHEFMRNLKNIDNEVELAKTMLDYEKDSELVKNILTLGYSHKSLFRNEVETAVKCHSAGSLFSVFSNTVAHNFFEDSVYLESEGKKDLSEKAETVGTFFYTIFERSNLVVQESVEKYIEVMHTAYKRIYGMDLCPQFAEIKEIIHD